MLDAFTWVPRLPRRILRLASIATALGLLNCLSGCVNLQAISDYTASAGAVVSDQAPLMRWHSSEAQLLAQRLEGDQCSIGRNGRPPQAEWDAAFQQAASVHTTLGHYFVALGDLAADQAPRPGQAVEASLNHVKHLGVNVSPADEAALHNLSTLLGRAMEGYRQEKIRLLMEQTHADVDRLIVLLQKLSGLYRDEVNGERVQAMQFLRCSMVRDDLSKFWGRREIARTQRSYEAELASLDLYTASLARIRQDHETIRQALALDDPNNLKTTLRALGGTRKDLEAARTALRTLRPITP